MRRKELERIAKIVSVVAVESVGAIIDCELSTETDVDAVAVRQVAHVTERVPATGKISRCHRTALRTSSCPDFWTRSQRK